MSKVWLVTGSASGLGRNIAEAVLASGDRLIATARDPRRLEDLVKKYGDQVRTAALDVVDESAAQAAVQMVRAAFVDLSLQFQVGIWLDASPQSAPSSLPLPGRGAERCPLPRRRTPRHHWVAAAWDRRDVRAFPPGRGSRSFPSYSAPWRWADKGRAHWRVARL